MPLQDPGRAPSMGSNGCPTGAAAPCCWRSRHHSVWRDHCGLAVSQACAACLRARRAPAGRSAGQLGPALQASKVLDVPLRALLCSLQLRRLLHCRATGLLFRGPPRPSWALLLLLSPLLPCMVLCRRLVRPSRTCRAAAGCAGRPAWQSLEHDVGCQTVGRHQGRACAVQDLYCGGSNRPVADHQTCTVEGEDLSAMDMEYLNQTVLLLVSKTCHELNLHIAKCAPRAGG